MSNYQSPWNKGLTKETDERVKINGINSGKANKGKLKGIKLTKKHCLKIGKGVHKACKEGRRIQWNKGKTKETDKRLATAGKNISKTKTGKKCKPFTKKHCKHLSERIFTKEWRENLGKAHKGIGKGIKFSKKRCLNLSKANKGVSRGKGRIFSKKHCEKLSINAAKQMIKNKQNHNWGYGKNSWFYSKKNHKRIHCLASGEKQCMQFLENNKNVISYKKDAIRILYWFEEKWHNYIPDFVVRYKNKKQTVIEVKTNNHLKDLQVKAKARAARRYCKKNNMEYKFWTENGFLD